MLQKWEQLMLITEFEWKINQLWTNEGILFIMNSTEEGWDSFSLSKYSENAYSKT